MSGDSAARRSASAANVLTALVAGGVAVCALLAIDDTRRAIGHAEAGGRARIPLCVLYAGDPVPSPRTASFMQLLDGHFATVRSMPLLDLAAADLTEIDVLVVDGECYESGYEQPRFLPPPTGLARGDLAVPTVLVGGRGGQVADALGLEVGLRYG